MKIHGFHFNCFSTPLLGGWHIERHELPTDKTIKHYISDSTIERLLDVTYTVMNGKFIQSNLIEGKNRVVRDILPNRGLKTLNHFYTYCHMHFTSWKTSNIAKSVPSGNECPVSASMALNNLFSFFKPSSERIEVITAKNSRCLAKF